MKSPTGRNSCDFEGCHFQQHFGTRSKKLRALGCRLEHVIFCFWYLNAENGNPQNRSNYDR